MKTLKGSEADFTIPGVQGQVPFKLGRLPPQGASRLPLHCAAASKKPDRSVQSYCEPSVCDLPGSSPRGRAAAGRDAGVFPLSARARLHFTTSRAAFPRSSSALAEDGGRPAPLGLQ